MTAILVLYEDSRGANGSFGPHDFFLGCVADAKGTSVHSLTSKARAMPVRGVAKLLEHLRNLDDLDRLAPRGSPILAVIDSDRLPDHYPAALGKTTTDVEDLLEAECSAPARLTVVLLERNLESVVEANSRLRRAGAGLVGGRAAQAPQRTRPAVQSRWP